MPEYTGCNHSFPTGSSASPHVMSEPSSSANCSLDLINRRHNCSNHWPSRLEWDVQRYSYTHSLTVDRRHVPSKQAFPVYCIHTCPYSQVVPERTGGRNWELTNRATEKNVCTRQPWVNHTLGLRNGPTILIRLSPFAYTQAPLKTFV